MKHGNALATVRWSLPPTKRYFYLHHAYNAAGFNFLGRQGVLSELVWEPRIAMAIIPVWESHTGPG